MTETKKGFSLIEVLVALVLTSLIAATFDQTFALARHSNRIPGELFVAVAKARMALFQAELSGASPVTSPASPFSAKVELSDLPISETPSAIAPPIPSSDKPPNAPTKERLRLREVTVIVTAPSGRRTELNGAATFLQPK